MIKCAHINICEIIKFGVKVAEQGGEEVYPFHARVRLE